MQALENVRVLDLTHVIAGPFTTYQLAVLGADVIKIESPDNPDMLRAEGAIPEDNRIGMGSLFTAQGANKRAITLNLKSNQGQEIFKRLVDTTDVLVENYRAGALGDLGLGYPHLSKTNPKLVYCSLTGFGQTGPKADHTAYDNVIQAFSGLMSGTGYPEAEPIKVGPPVLDYGTGAQAAVAILAALYRREKTGKGEHIDIAMLDAALMLMSINATHYDMAHQSPPRHGNNSITYGAYACFDTQEGQLMVGGYSVKQHEDLWRTLGENDRADQIKGLSPEQLSQYKDDDYHQLQQIFLTDTADHWEQLLNNYKVPAARVRSIEESLRHEQITGRQVLQTIDSPVLGKSLRLPVAAYSFTEDGPRLDSPPPELGQHTEEIMNELGYSPDELEKFRDSGVI